MVDYAPIEITFILRGTIVAEIEAIHDPVDRVLCRAAAYRIQRRLRHLFCAKHHQHPRVIAAGPSADQLSFSVEGCCQELIDAAVVKLP